MPGDDPVTVRTRKLLALTLTGALAVAGLAACDPILDGPSTPQPGVNASAAVAQLNSLTVGGWASMSGYSRDRFHTWESQGNGCDTRDRGQQLQMSFIKLSRTRTDVEVNHAERFVESHERHTQ